MWRWPLLMLCLLWALMLPSEARVGVPVQTSWDYATTMTNTGVATLFQIQRCPVSTCTATCTPEDMLGATTAIGTNWGSAVSTGTLANDPTVKAITFTATTGRYVKLVETSEVNGNPWGSAAEIKIYNNSTVIPQAQITIVSADSQEFAGENGAAQRVLDGNTATIWHTAWFSQSPPPPHTLIFDLGQSYAQINRLDYTPRQDGGSNGTIAGYQLYIASSLTSTWTDTAVTGGQAYRYQAVAVGIVNTVAARSAPSSQVCLYVKAQVRGRPEAIDR